MRTLLFISLLSLVCTVTSCKKEDNGFNKPYFDEILSGKAGSGTGNGSKFGSMRDIDGNTYKTVTIGNQIWMAENLRVTKYRNGDPILKISNVDEWNNTSYGAWCYYANDATIDPVFGKLYNWTAVNDSRGLAPKGWHIPSVYEAQELVTQLGGTSVAGGKMKESGLFNWYTPNTDATNESGFTGRPGGYNEYGVYRYSTYNACFWTSTLYTAGAANGFFLYFDSPICTVGGYSPTSNGYSIRCVKD